MATINTTLTPMSYRRKLILGGILMSCSMICILMTIIFLYVSNTANKRVEEIREDYRVIAARREDKVDLLTDQVNALQNKLNALSDHVAGKNSRVNNVAIEGDRSAVKSTHNP